MRRPLKFVYCISIIGSKLQEIQAVVICCDQGTLCILHNYEKAIKIRILHFKHWVKKLLEIQAVLICWVVHTKMVQRTFKKQLKIIFCPIRNTIIKIGVYFKSLLYNILINSQYDSTPFTNTTYTFINKKCGQFL